MNKSTISSGKKERRSVISTDFIIKPIILKTICDYHNIIITTSEDDWTTHEVCNNLILLISMPHWDILFGVLDYK